MESPSPSFRICTASFLLNYLTFMKQKNPAAKLNADTRLAHARHERAIKATGLIYQLLALGLFLAATTGILMRNWRGTLSWNHTLWVGGVFIALAALYFVVGHGLRKLASWAGYAAGGLALLCLSSVIINPAVQHPFVFSVAVIRVFALPVGIIITLYGAYLTLVAKGKVVLNRDYREANLAAGESDLTFSKVFLAVGIVLACVQSLNVLMIFTGRPN
jgi:uncharacterized membrane protein (DUF2068 family)